eukprot:TRINITY_DN3970_c0_g1_i3.p1 TRINITY_DN3970_c0_g1~~TRINITY_DN3970_c0_g1_i3.p1  ORF type:complete len:152 (-),score=9.68 TRINITY_DN3970_c0_g1_i3:5-460(-)
MIRRPPRSTQGVSSAASDVYKRQVICLSSAGALACLMRIQYLILTHPQKSGDRQQTLQSVKLDRGVSAALCSSSKKDALKQTCLAKEGRRLCIRKSMIRGSTQSLSRLAAFFLETRTQTSLGRNFIYKFQNLVQDKQCRKESLSYIPCTLR